MFCKITESYYLCRLFNKNHDVIMSKICDITGKRVRVGNHVSHANNKTKRTFSPNLQTKKFFIPEEDRWVTLKVSITALKTITKKGLGAVIKEAAAKGTLNKQKAKKIFNK